MAIFSKSLKQLLQEEAELEALLDAKWAALAQEGPISVEVAETSFKPEHVRLVALKNQILDKSPRKKLISRRDELQRILGSTFPKDVEAARQQAELIRIDGSLRRTKDLSLPVVAITFGIAALLLVAILAMNYF